LLRKSAHGLTLLGTENNVWYQLLETGIATHDSSLFVIPETWTMDNRDKKISELI